MTIKRLIQEPSEYPPMTAMLTRVMALVEAARTLVKGEDIRSCPPGFTGVIQALAELESHGDIEPAQEARR